MIARDFTHNGKPEPCPVGPGRHERLEQAVTKLLANARTGIAHPQEQFVFMMNGIHRNASAGGRILDGIEDQIVEGPLHLKQVETG